MATALLRYTFALVLLASLASAEMLNMLGPGINVTKTPEGWWLVHLPMLSTALFGNSTEMMYYYATLYVGSQDAAYPQALIIDTGSGIMSFPCAGYCKHCGDHINEPYPFKSKYFILILRVSFFQNPRLSYGLRLLMHQRNYVQVWPSVWWRLFLPWVLGWGHLLHGRGTSSAV